MTSTTLETNPLREGLSSARTAEPCTIVIFGASGDLTERMLIPSLFALSEQRLVAPELSVLGISRRPFSDAEFRTKVKPDSGNATNWDSFSRGVFYMSGDHHQEETYQRLKARLAGKDEVIAEVTEEPSGRGATRCVDARSGRWQRTVRRRCRTILATIKRCSRPGGGATRRRDFSSLTAITSRSRGSSMARSRATAPT